MTIFFIVSLWACGEDGEQAMGGTLNRDPVAVLRTPVIAPLERPVELDASRSFDPDGDTLKYVFEFTDGSRPASADLPISSHRFTGPGLFTVRLRVLDPTGAESAAEHDITIRLEYPEPPNFCSVGTDCVVGVECVDAVCFNVGGTLDPGEPDDT